MELTQDEADRLFLIHKKSFDEFTLKFPSEGERVTLEVFSDNKRYQFQADIHRQGNIKPKLTFQNRYNKIFVLRRLDIIGAPHTNPPDAMGIDFPAEFVNADLPCPHLHIYFEGFDDKWALPLDKVTDIVISEKDSPFDIMTKFFKYCNIEVPNFDLDLFQ